MRTRVVYILSRSTPWLDTARRLSAYGLEIRILPCEGDPAVCLSRVLPDADGLLLLDSTLPGPESERVRQALDNGWRYVVCLATTPAAKEARAVLRAGAADYWPKSVDAADLAGRIQVLQREIDAQEASTGECPVTNETRRS